MRLRRFDTIYRVVSDEVKRPEVKRGLTLGTIALIVIGLLVFSYGAFKPSTKVKALATNQGDGILFYAAASNTTPQWRTYSNSANDFSANSGTVAGAQPVITQVKTSPTKQEAIAGYQDTSGNLRVLCYDGTSWTQEWTIAVAPSGTPTTRRFDIAFETNTGDVTVAYSRNTAAVNALAYRTKSGSSVCGTANWAAATNFPTTTTATSATVMWVRAVRDGRSAQNLSAWVWLDNAATNADLGGAIWSGSAFTNFKSIETSMEHITAVGDTDNFEVQYESLSGDVMVVWGNSAGANGTNGSRYMTCTGGTSSCTWGSATAIPSLLDDATNVDLSSDPLSDKMIFSSIGNAGSDLQVAYWTGSAWTGYPNIDTSTETPAAGRKLMTTGWITNNGNTKYYISYDDSTGTGISWFAQIPGATLTSTAGKQTDFTSAPAINDIRGRYDTDMNPFNNAELIQTISDSTNNIFAYKLTMDTAGNPSWSNMASASSLGTKPVHPQQGFSFTYWRYIPITLGVSASVNRATESWFGEVQIYGTPTGSLDSGNYPQGSVRAKIVTPSITGYPASTVYKEMTWSAGNSRWEATYKLGTDGYGAGLADPRTGTYNITVQLDGGAPYFENDGDYQYSSNTSFSTYVIKRRPNSTTAEAYTAFIPVYDTNHWNYTITGLALVATAANTDATITLPVYPTTATISNVIVTGTGVDYAIGYASTYWNATDHSIVFSLDTINGTRTVNITFDSSTDLFGTRTDVYQTTDLGIRNGYNGFTVANKELSMSMFGGGYDVTEGTGVAADHEGAGELVDMHAKNATVETTLDCMERVALHVDDTTDIDASGYYNGNIKWKQTDWMDWLTFQDDSKIVIENTEDDTASPRGWIQKVGPDGYNIDAHRKVTFFASENYIRHEYDFTNNGSSSHKLSFVWGREQWIEGPSGGTQALYDRGIVPDDPTDYISVKKGVYGTPGTNEYLMSQPWFAIYDTGSMYFMGEVFPSRGQPDTTWFHTLNADSNMPISSSATYGYVQWPILNSSSGEANAESHFFDKSWNSVVPTQQVKFDFLQVGGKYEGGVRADIDTFFDNVSLPTFAVTPNNTGGGAASTTVTYTNNVQNNSSKTDTINLSAVSSQGWTTEIWNAAETSQISSVNLGPGANVDVKVKVIIPPGTPDSTVDITTLIGESDYNGLTETATNTTTVSGTTVTLDIQEVYDPNITAFDTIAPFSMNFGDVAPGQQYKIGEGLYSSETYAVKMNVNVSGASFKLQTKATANFDPATPGNAFDDIDISRLFYAKDSIPNNAVHNIGDWTSFALTDQDLYNPVSAGNYTYYFDYRLLLDWSDKVSDSNSFTTNIIYTVTTTTL